MLAFIPLRVFTMAIALLLGYSVGDWIEKIYDRHNLPREAVERLLFRVAESVCFDGMEEDEDDDLEHLCFDCCGSSTDSDDDTDLSE